MDLQAWAGALKRLAERSPGFRGVSLGTDPLSPRCATPGLGERWRDSLRDKAGTGVLLDAV